MSETYTSGIWLVKEGEEDLFVAAWREFAEWARTMPGAELSGSFAISTSRPGS
jgi:hypothetical protein